MILDFFPTYLDTSFLASNTSDGDSPSCSYEWCQNIPMIQIPQFMVGFVVATIGYTFCLALSGSIYSRVLGSCNAVCLNVYC